MPSPTTWHLIGGFTVTAFTALVWWIEGPSVLSKVLIGITDIYLVLILFEAAQRLDKKLATSQAAFLEFPTLKASLVQTLFVLITVVCGFATMYIQSGEVANNVGGLKDKVDALYYSMVTITTLGYGDFAPTGIHARLLVVWQLFTGFLFLLCILPLVVARLSAYK
jgi:hypothetical protein